MTYNIVFAFDRDGTVSTSGGPVPLDVVIELSRKYVVYAVGNPLLSREANIPYANGVTKMERLRWIIQMHPDADEYIVVDDIPLLVEGWTYYSPQEFVCVMNKYL